MLVAEIVLLLAIRDLTRADLPACAWSGGATHLASVARALDRAARGEVDYLAVCPPSGLPVALGGIDYTACNAGGFVTMAGVSQTPGRDLELCEPGVRARRFAGPERDPHQVLQRVLLDAGLLHGRRVLRHSLGPGSGWESSSADRPLSRALG
jgi:NAD(P)-dependent dehydrogenase (short-subunit alcohol dehydrogenase family)